MNNAAKQDVMKNFSIRALQQDDMAEISRLICTRDDIPASTADTRLELMQWLAFQNPYANGEPTYFVVESPEGIVAYHGRMPMSFLINGSPHNSYYVHDLYVDPRYREKGMGFWLTRALAKHIEKSSANFFCLFGMTPLNLQIHRRFNYYESIIPGFAKPIDPQRELKRLLKFDGLVRLINPFISASLSCIDMLFLGSQSRGVKVSPVERFDDSFSALAKTLSRNNGINIEKSAAYLNWKYIDRPYRREVIFAAYRNGNLSGYTIVSPSPYQKDTPVGILIDLMANPSDKATVAALINAAAKYCRQNGLHSLRGVFSNPQLGKTLRHGLFFPTEGKAFMIGNLGKASVQNDHLKNLKNWHITLGESDTYMLSL